jgi:hypothetical protein
MTLVVLSRILRGLADYAASVRSVVRNSILESR